MACISDRDNSLSIDCDEQTTFDVDVLLLDENGDPVPLSAVSAITMTLIEVESGEIVNDREQQDVKNTNDCTYTAETGEFVWSVQTEDTAIVGITKPGSREKHEATFTATWGDGKQIHWVVLLQVMNLRSISTPEDE